MDGTESNPVDARQAPEGAQPRHSRHSGEVSASTEELRFPCCTASKASEWRECQYPYPSQDTFRRHH